MTPVRKISVLMFLTVVFMASLWAIDISTSAMNTGGTLTNGFWSPDPAQIYHFGVGVAIACFFTVVLIAINSVLRRETEVRDK